MSTAVETTPYLRLSVDQGSNRKPNAAVMVRWELSDEALQSIIDQGVRDPHIMLVVVNNHREIEGTRVVRPLGDAMARLEVPKAGKSVIYGMIMYRRSDTKKTARYFMRLSESDFLHRVPKGERALTLQIDEYTRQMDERSGDDSWQELRKARDVLYTERDNLSYSSIESYIEFDRDYSIGIIGQPVAHEIEILAGAVSKKHPIADRYCRILPWWWDKRVRNNCERRNRVMWTSLLSPIWLPLAIVLGSMTAVGLVLYWLARKVLMLLLVVLLSWIGVRGVSYSPLWRVRHFKILDVIDEDGEDFSSYWVTKRVADKTVNSGYRLVPRALIWRIVNPITVVLGALTVIFALTFTGYSLLTLIPLLALLGATWGFSSVFVGLKPVKDNSGSQKATTLNKSVLTHDLSSLVYDPSNAPAVAKFSALPKEKRTFHQWFLSLKQVVCKPIER